MGKQSSRMGALFPDARSIVQIGCVFRINRKILIGCVRVQLELIGLVFQTASNRPIGSCRNDREEHALERVHSATRADRAVDDSARVEGRHSRDGISGNRVVRPCFDRGLRRFPERDRATAKSANRFRSESPSSFIPKQCLPLPSQPRAACPAGRRGSLRRPRRRAHAAVGSSSRRRSCGRVRRRCAPWTGLRRMPPFCRGNSESTAWRETHATCGWRAEITSDKTTDVA